MSELWLIREGMSFRAFGSESADVLSRLPFGKVFKAEVKQPRNGKHHRLFWTLCARIGNAVGCEHEDIAFLLKLRTGHVRHIKTKHGLEEVPKSISFAAMDQTAFTEFFDKCVHTIYNEFGIAVPDILEAVKDLLEEPESPSMPQQYAGSVRA